MKELLRRTIHPETRVIDSKTGQVEYIASDETVDSYNEVIRASGWRFDDFQKNAPFVDSHNYSSVDSCLGRVIDFRVSGSRLIETVQWAIDVPSNELARLGFDMTAAGYLRAVSVGFVPGQVAVPYGADLSDYTAQCRELGIDPKNGPQCIYVDGHQQKELSACVLGANPSAVAKARSAGILSDELAQRLFPKQAQSATPRRSYSFGAKSNPPMSKATFLSRFKSATGQTADTDPETATKSLELARRGNSESAYLSAIGNWQRAHRAEQTDAIRAGLRALFQDEETHQAFAGFFRAIFSKRVTPRQESAMRSIGIEMKYFTQAASDALGTSLTANPVSSVIHEYTEIAGVYRTLGLMPMLKGNSKLARITALPKAQWTIPDQQPTQLVADSSIDGDGISARAGSLGVLLEPAAAYWDDLTVDGTIALVLACVEGLSAGMDIACFAGTGANDGDNGGQVGLFPHGDVANVNAAPGNVAVASLSRADFLSLASTVNPKALQRGSRFWVNPTHLPSLMLLKDGTRFLVKSPIENGTDEWSLCGFPMSLTVAAPSATVAGSQICAFGYGPAYNVGVRQELEIMASYGTHYSQAMHALRVLMRARCEMAMPTWFAILKLAAV